MIIKTKLLLSGAVALALAAPGIASAQSETDLTQAPAGYEANSGLDEAVPDQSAVMAPAATGNPVLDRLNALETRIKQLEARNAELESAAAETQTRVEKVEVRAAKAVQPGPAPTFADVRGNFTFKPRGTIQVDYAAYNERAGGYDYNNGTDIRRARFGFDGTFFKAYKYRIEAEYVKGAVNLLDAYVQYTGFKKLTVTVGQHKTPYGLEANTSDPLNSFLERGMANVAFGAIGAERRVGVSVGYATDKFTATGGVFGAGESVVRANRVDEAYGFNGRVTFDPILEDGKVLHLGASAYKVTNLPQTNPSITISDRPNTRVDGGNIVSAPITQAKSATYLGLEAAVVYKHLSIQGEYNRLRVNRITGADPTFDGYYVFASYFLTGESRVFKGGTADRVKPRVNFNPSAGEWGAVELLARYDALDLTDRDFSPLSRKAQTFTGGVSWYLNPNLKFLVNYVRFKGQNSPLVVAPASINGTTAKGDVLTTRLQVDF